MVAMSSRRRCFEGLKVFLADVRNDIHGFGGGEEGDERTVGVEAEISVISHDMDRSVPRCVMKERMCSGSGVINRADINSREPNARKCLKHLSPARQRFGNLKSSRVHWKRVIARRERIFTPSFDVTCKGVMHGSEPKLRPLTQSSPNQLLMGNEICQSFTD